MPLWYGYGSKAWFGQSLYTSFSDVLRKIENSREIVLTFREKLGRMKIFSETKKELNFKFKTKLTEEQIANIVKIFVELASAIEANGIKSAGTD